jgi:hypothetical protein
MKCTCVAALMTGSVAMADGFAQMDLTQISIDAKAFDGGVMDARAQPDRATVFCSDCEDIVALDIQFSRSTDGTEGRFRSGETTVKKMEDICKSRDPSCTLTRVDVGPATGWMTTYGTNSTVVLFRDGDVLTMRSVSGDAAISVSNARQAITAIAPQIVGN